MFYFVLLMRNSLIWISTHSMSFCFCVKILFDVSAYAELSIVHLLFLLSYLVYYIIQLLSYYICICSSVWIEHTSAPWLLMSFVLFRDAKCYSTTSIIIHITIATIMYTNILLADFSCNKWHIVSSSITFVLDKTRHIF